MPEATCHNADCEKEPWQLQKHVSQYSRGWPSCPECGSTQVLVDGHSRDDVVEVAQNQNAEIEPAQAGGTGGEQAQEIATQGDGSVANAGEAAVGTIMTLTDENAPDQAKAQAAGSLLQFAHDAFTGYQQWRNEKRQANVNRARNAELEPVDDFPSCECDYTFGPNDLVGEQARCPECGRLYNVHQITG